MRARIKLAAIAKMAFSLGSAVVFLVVLIGIIAWMAGVFEEKIQPAEVELTVEKASPEELSTAYTVREISKQVIEEAVGTLKAASRTEISSRVLGAIEEVKVRAGSNVRAGDELIRLDRRALETQLSQAEASLVAAEAAEKRAHSDYERAGKLYQQKAISQEAFDQAIETVKVARAKLKHAREARAEAEVLLSYTTITAPKDGMIVDRLAEKGDMARPGEPLLILYDPTSLRLEVPVVEHLAVNLHEGDELKVYIDARDRTVPAVVDEIVPQAEAASRSFLVKVRLPRSKDLFEGMFGRLLIPTGERRHLCLHTGTIERVGQLQFVEVIEDNGTKQRRLITTGRYGDPQHLEVLSGLRAGEHVVMQNAP